MSLCKYNLGIFIPAQIWFHQHHYNSHAKFVLIFYRSISHELTSQLATLNVHFCKLALFLSPILSDVKRPPLILG